VNPVGRRSGYLLSRSATFEPLGLAYTAAATPSEWEVKIADENFDEFSFEEADLVGITAFTGNVTRAYEIAQGYRARNTKVIMGGIHVSMLPDEALRYADSVVVGEAEGIWEKVISDFENGRLSTKYVGPRIDLAQCNITPRRDLLHPNYIWHSVQTSRGCPFDCNFCSVSRYLGKEFRQRTAKDVLNELDEINGEYIAFLDDNLIGYSPQSKTRAMELFEGMIQRGLNKKWWMQTSINAADDEQLVGLASKAGCMIAFIGFESIEKRTLKHMGKGVNLKIGVENYRKVVNVFHKYGIGVIGAFIIGNDYESPAYYKKLADFLIHSGIDSFQIAILTPLPGTTLMKQLQKEKRLIYQNFPNDWDKYRLSYIVHQPKALEPEAVYIADNYIKNRLYSFPTYPYRVLKSLYSLKDPTSFYANYKFNKALKKSWQNSHYYKEYPNSLDAIHS
jgi:radical SAM superfamily enzyme YgiQ (UPF0313 family)